jgi:hypothetical protein
MGEVALDAQIAVKVVELEMVMALQAKPAERSCGGLHCGY